MNEQLASLQLNVLAVLPELILVLFALVVMMVDAFGPGASEENPGGSRALPWVAGLGVVAAAGACAWLWTQPVYTFQGQVTTDHFSLTVRLIVLTSALLAILFSHSYIQRVNAQVGEYYALLLLCSVGMMLMGAATDLIVLFVALEIFSLGLYILTGLHRSNPRSTEAAMKYFLLGAFTSAFFVYGAALIYGATGSTQYDAIAQAVESNSTLYTLYAGIALLLVGLGFKISAVPFHMWTPDVYQGAPTPVTAFMSAGTKAAAFAALARVLVVGLQGAQPTWGWLLAGLAALTMILGNLAALRQQSLKRMLAYSTVAHAGYILTALTPGTAQGVDAATFYLFTYAFMSMGAFAVIMTLERTVGEDALQAHARGLGKRAPLLAFLMAIFLFSLSGMPPLAGFFAKLFVFSAAIQGGWTWLAVIGMITSAIAAYYYIRVIVAMYFEQPETDATTPHTWGSLQVGLAVAAAVTIVVGILPGFWMGFFQSGFGG